MRELPYSIPGGQQVQFTPYQIGGRNGATAEVIGNGAIQSFNYVADTTGWRIEGNGDVEFGSGDFRGTLTGATGTFDGDISGASGTFTGDISGGAIDIGGADTTSFHVDVAGNMWLGAATYAAAPFKVSDTGSLTATSGTFSGTVSAATFQNANALTNAASHTLSSGNFSAGVSGWQIAGDGDAEFNNIVARGSIATAASGKRIEFGTLGNDQISFYDGIDVTPGKLEVVTDGFQIVLPGGVTLANWSPNIVDFVSTLFRIIGDDYGVVFSSNHGVVESDGNAVHVFPGDASVDGRRIRIGAGGGPADYYTVHSAGLHPTFMGLYHDQLDQAFLIQSDGSDTWIGTDDEIYFKKGTSTSGYFTGSQDLVLNAYPSYTSWTAYPGTTQPYFYQYWTNNGGSFETLKLWREPIGTVHLQGLVKWTDTVATGGASAICLIPSDMRPSATIIATGMSSGGLVDTRVQSNGQVICQTSVASNAWVSVNLTWIA